MKAGKKGLNLPTACQFPWKEGFKFTEHKKALNYNGHEHPNVVPMMEEYQQCLVKYVAGDVDKELEKPYKNYFEWHLVLVAHDEMTAQQNDGKKSWVFNVKKKGQCHGIHQSDVICSTMGHMVDVGQSLKYSKNYEDY